MQTREDEPNQDPVQRPKQPTRPKQHVRGHYANHGCLGRRPDTLARRQLHADAGRNQREHPDGQDPYEALGVERKAQHREACNQEGIVAPVVLKVGADTLLEAVGRRKLPEKFVPPPLRRPPEFGELTRQQSVSKNAQ